MQCPACNAENETEAMRCGTCGRSLGRRPKRRGLAEETNTPFAPRAEGSNRAALRAYRLSVLGIIPGVGLLLGPVALVLGILARHRGKADPSFTADSPALASVLLGVAETVTNWLGLALMILGWKS